MSHWSSSVPAEISSNARFMKYRRRVLSKAPTVSPLMRVVTVCANLSAVAITLAIVFTWDFGEKEHVFSGARRWKKSIENDFFVLTKEELEEYKKA